MDDNERMSSIVSQIQSSPVFLNALETTKPRSLAAWEDAHGDPWNDEHVSFEIQGFDKEELLQLTYTFVDNLCGQDLATSVLVCTPLDQWPERTKTLHSLRGEPVLYVLSTPAIAKHYMGFSVNIEQRYCQHKANNGTKVYIIPSYCTKH